MAPQRVSRGPVAGSGTRQGPLALPGVREARPSRSWGSPKGDRKIVARDPVNEVTGWLLGRQAAVDIYGLGRDVVGVRGRPGTLRGRSDRPCLPLRRGVWTVCRPVCAPGLPTPRRSSQCCSRRGQGRLHGCRTGPTQGARQRVSMLTAALEASYTASSLNALVAATELMLMILPYPPLHHVGRQPPCSRRRHLRCWCRRSA